MPHEFTVRRRVAFADTDLAGLVHFSRFFVYMETTEHDFYRTLGFNVLSGGPETGWPRAQASCEYKAPLWFDQEFDVQLLVAEKRSKGLRYQFVFRTIDETPVELARGSLSAVYVTFVEGKIAATEIPPEIWQQIEVAPADMLA